jgi:Bacterial PH domain
VNQGGIYFFPPRRFGLIFQGGLILVFTAIGLWSLWRLTEASLGALFVRDLLIAILALGPLPLFIYRFRALQGASYNLARDGIRLRWGFRAVDLPIDQVIWVHPRQDLLTGLPRPWLFWPGAVLGTSIRSLTGAGRVEYMASNLSGLVLIGTNEKVYAVSPEDVEGFINTYQRMIELGSITPIPARSERPEFFLAQLWQNRPLRYLFLIAALLSLLLFVWVSLVIPAMPGVYMGTGGQGFTQDLLPPTALLLLPFMNTVFQALTWGLGIFFYRRETQRPLAYLLWACSILSASLFLVTLALILTNT